jgi:hypothetical protein
VSSIFVPEHPLRRAAEADLRSVISAIERLTGLTSRWVGAVWVRDDAFPNSGQKHGWSGISVREDVLRHRSRRWRTLIHEGLHSVSGVVPTGHLDARNRRWEEGIVEQTQRLLRQRVLRGLGVSVSEGEFVPDDVLHAYNDYIRALEQVRTSAGEEMEPFYLGLLRATISGRASVVVAATRGFGVQRGEGTP